MEFYLQSNSVMDSLKCLKSKSLSHCLTKLLPIYQNKHWTIRRRSFNPWSYCIVSKIVGFLYENCLWCVSTASFLFYFQLLKALRVWSVFSIYSTEQYWYWKYWENQNATKRWSNLRKFPGTFLNYFTLSCTVVNSWEVFLRMDLGPLTL